MTSYIQVKFLRELLTDRRIHAVIPSPNSGNPRFYIAGVN